MSEHTAWEELAAGYAVNALEPEDEHAFESHLRGCEACQATLTALQAVASEVAYAAEPAEPPDGLRRRILDAAAAERPAVFGATPPTPVATHARRPWRALAWRPRWETAAAAAALLAVVALVGWNVTLRGDSRAQQAALDRRSAAVRCLVSPDAPRFRLMAAGERRATACLAGSSAYVVADHLDRNDTGRSVYVLWWLDAQDVPHAVERFDVTADGMTVLELPLDAAPSDVRAMAVSLEPGRGLPEKPTRPIAAGPATSA